MKILIVGKGSVGGELEKLAKAIPWEPRFYPGRAADGSFTAEALNADAVFIAISTKDKGEAELSFILKCIELEKPVVTCAKGALAWHFETLKPHMRRIGYAATVGGASGILALAETGWIGSVEEISGILNGTLNFLCWRSERGEWPLIALERARAKRLCEPGASSLADTVNGEMQDVIRKASILFNVLDIGPIISPDDFSYSLLAEDEIKRVLDPATAAKRFVVSISRDGRQGFGFDPLYLKTGIWTIRGGFVYCGEEEFGKWPGAADNALVIRRKDAGREIMSGLGAGADATAAKMICDLMRLRERFEAGAI